MTLIFIQMCFLEKWIKCMLLGYNIYAMNSGLLMNYLTHELHWMLNYEFERGLLHWQFNAYICCSQHNYICNQRCQGLVTEWTALNTKVVFYIEYMIVAMNLSFTWNMNLVHLMHRGCQDKQIMIMVITLHF